MTIMPSPDQRITAVLTSLGIPHTVQTHAPEGRTLEVSALRGHPPHQALKCLVLIVKLGKKTSRYVLAVVRGDQRVDVDAVRRLYGATYVGIATAGKARELSGCEPGTVVPFSFTPDLEIVADASLSGDNTSVYFNAGALDRSLTLTAVDYITAAAPRIGRIGAPLDVTVGARS